MGNLTAQSCSSGRGSGMTRYSWASAGPGGANAGPGVTSGLPAAPAAPPEALQNADEARGSSSKQGAGFKGRGCQAVVTPSPGGSRAVPGSRMVPQGGDSPQPEAGEQQRGSGA